MPARTVATLLFVAAPAGVLAASAPPVQPTSEQVELYAAANAAYDAADFDAAITRLDEAIALGPLNILYLSKGRSMQQLGRCEDARDQYGLVEAAPPVAEPPPEAVAGRAAAYLEELQAQCPGHVKASCGEPDVLIAVGDEPPQPCASFEHTVMPGSVTLVATRGSSRQRVEATVTAFETTVVTIAMEPESSPAPQPEPDGVERDRWTPMIRAGQISLGIGAAALVSAVLVDAVLGPRRIDAFEQARLSGDGTARDRQQSARAAQVGAIAAYAVGVATVVTGSVLWAVGASKRKRSTPRASVSAGGVVVRF